jgi:GDPmannose 4,6-dehydratase
MPLALIIGHTGQDGQLLRQQLCERGYSVVGISTARVDSWNFKSISSATSLGWAGITDFITVYQPDQIYFLAAHHHSSQDLHTNHDHTWQSSLDIHVNGFRLILEGIKRNAPDSRVFYASSSRIFGHAGLERVNEASLCKPECIYGITKLLGMQIAAFYRRNFNLYVCAGILFNHESSLRGKTFVSQRIINGLIEIKRGKSSTLELGNLDARVDWGYAGDYVRAMRYILDAKSPDDYVIASGNTHSVRDFVRTAAERLDLDWEPVVVQRAGILARNPQHLCGDTTKLSSVTGWQPETSFEEMIHSMVDCALMK